MVAKGCHSDSADAGFYQRIRSSWGLSDNLSLLLGMVSPFVDEAAHDRVSRAAVRGADWDALLALAHRHRLTPLLHRGVASTWREYVPEAHRETLSVYVRQNTLRNMMLVSQCVNTLELLRQAEVPTIAYKGPVLAQRLYGSPGMRLYGDLDILVPVDDVPRTLELMTEGGYTPVHGLATYLDPEYLAAKREARMLAPRTGVLIEIQWRVAAHWEICLGAAGLRDMWLRTEPVRLAGHTANAFGREDLLVILSAHAACHCFQWLGSICDIAELIRTNPDMDWDHIEAVADRMRVRRMVRMAVFLCHALLGQPMPEAIAGAIRREQATLVRLGRLALDAIDSESNLSDNLWSEARMHIGLREQLADKTRFARHYIRAYTEGITSSAKLADGGQA